MLGAVVFACISLLAACAETDDAVAPSVSVPSDDWAVAHADDLERLDGAIEHIASAVKSNDVTLLGDGPQQCAAVAANLSSSADAAGAVGAGFGLGQVAALCEWLTGPASANDVRGVVQTLDPLFIAVGRITPLLDLIDHLN